MSVSAPSLVRSSGTIAPGEFADRATDRTRESVIRPPLFLLGLIVGLSALLRGSIGLTRPSPWILPDEVVYSELAKSIADGARPAIRGIPAFGWGEVYPTLIAPAWALFDDPVRAYHVALAINGVVMSLAAIPAYFLARMFVSRRSSLLVAGLTVLVPSMAYTGVVMTENAFYPVFLLALLLIARAVRTPAWGTQALALIGLGLAAFTRIQGMALVGAYAGAVLLNGLMERSGSRASYLRKFTPTVMVGGMVSLLPVVASLVSGEGVLGWLGSREDTFAEFRPQEIPEWFIYLAAGLVLYVAVAPAIATVVVVGRGATSQAPQHARLFSAIALPTILALLLSVAFVSASLDVDGTENLNERYVFYVVPLLVIGLAMWIDAGLPRRRPWAWFVLATCCLLPVLLPIDRLAYNAGFQSVALLPWLSLRSATPSLTVLVAAFALACGAVWATCRKHNVGRLWLLLAVNFVFVGTVTYESNDTSSSIAESAFPGGSASWIDDAVPSGTNVPMLWDVTAEGRFTPGTAYYWLMSAEILNASVGEVYRLGRPTYYETFLPTVPVRRQSDATLVTRNGRAVRSRYILVTCRTPVRGRLIAQAPGGLLRLVEVRGRVELLPRPTCPRVS